MSIISNEFETEKIICDKLHNGKRYYLVQWKNTTTSCLDSYKYWKNDVKKVIKKNDEQYVIVWKNTWMLFEDLIVGSDEILGAYLLLNLRKFK